ncbi:tetratricopeptide repeat protein, partial [Klebsiella pneumoniae]|nr:tetratricopeptide repeat protein [Klebsiella pneumoniae]
MSFVGDMLAMAQNCCQENDFQAAESIYRQILASDPANVDVWCLLGTACHCQGKAAEAELSLRRGLQL